MGLWDDVKRLDTRVNERLGLPTTPTGVAEQSERWWWLGGVCVGTVWLSFRAAEWLSGWPLPDGVLLPGFVVLAFSGGFYYNERLRSLRRQSRWSALQWRYHNPHDRAALNDDL